MRCCLVEFARTIITHLVQIACDNLMTNTAYHEYKWIAISDHVKGTTPVDSVRVINMHTPHTDAHAHQILLMSSKLLLLH